MKPNGIANILPVSTYQSGNFTSFNQETTHSEHLDSSASPLNFFT